jgi:HTH-type transcriptional regulator/antitoxin HigA
MEIMPIKAQRDYRRVLKEIEGLMRAKRNTPQGDRLDVLVTLVEAWERKHFPLDLPDPVEAIRFQMEQSGLEPRDLVPFIGSRNRVHEVLNRKRPLTLKMIRRLHEGLGIPAESLIKAGPDPGGVTALVAWMEWRVGWVELFCETHREGATPRDRRWVSRCSTHPTPLRYGAADPGAVASFYSAANPIALALLTSGAIASSASAATAASSDVTR